MNSSSISCYTSSVDQTHDLSDYSYQSENAALLREMDELWYQILYSNDIYTISSSSNSHMRRNSYPLTTTSSSLLFKLKSLVLFNIKFLMTSVKEASIGYLR